MAEFQKPLYQPTTPAELPIRDNKTLATNNTVTFLEILKPLSGSPEETLQFIRQKIEEAGFESQPLCPSAQA